MTAIPRLRLALAATGMVALVATCSVAASVTDPVTPPTSTGELAAEASLAPPGPTLGCQRAGDVLVWLASTPAQPTRGDARIDAYVVTTDGQQIQDARVTFDTDMTNMSHGQYLVAAEATGNGHYAGRVHFLMPGPWRIIAVLERPGTDTLKLRFEFNVGASPGDE